MSRYRWFNAEWPISIRTLAKRLKAASFGEESSHGFVIDRVRDDYLEARYVERIQFTDTVIDPFGRELAFEHVEFRQCSFKASGTAPGLELLDAPRSTQNLLNRLAEASDFSLAINPFSVDVLAWAARFQSLAGIELIVDSVQLGALELETGITAKAIIKGERDVRSACARLTSKRKYAMEKIQLRFTDPKPGLIILSNSGAAKFDAVDPLGAYLDIIRRSLAEVTK